MENLKSQLLEKINQTNTLKDLDQLKIELFGKKGVITEQMKNLATLSVEEKKEMGMKLNLLKKDLESEFEQKYQKVSLQEMNKKLQEEAIDMSLTTRPELNGKIHPMTLCQWSR